MTAGLFILVIAWLLSACSSVQTSLFDLGLSVERYRSGLRLKALSMDGDTYAYLEREGSGETIVLLHGFASNKDSWIRFIRYLPEKYRVVALDMPGHGDSRLDMNRSYSIEYLSGSVARLIDSLGIQRLHMAGNSLGGLVATLYALNHPEKLITLGLFDSAGVASPVQSEFYSLLKKGDNPLVVETEEDFDRLMAFNFFDEPFIPWPGRPVLARRFVERSEFNQKMWDDLFGSRLHESLNARLEALTMPAFILWGDNDRILHVSCTEIYNKHIRDAHVVIMRNCGHAPMLERPQEAAAHYSTFLYRIKV